MRSYLGQDVIAGEQEFFELNAYLVGRVTGSIVKGEPVGDQPVSDNITYLQLGGQPVVVLNTLNELFILGLGKTLGLLAPFHLHFPSVDAQQLAVNFVGPQLGAATFHNIETVPIVVQMTVGNYYPLHCAEWVA